MFNNYFCVACHVMKAAGPASYRGYNVCNGSTACNLGMNFNKIYAPYAVAVATVENGLPAALPLYPTQMVSFGKVLTKTQITDVATFVGKYSGGIQDLHRMRRHHSGWFPEQPGQHDRVDDRLVRRRTPAHNEKPCAMRGFSLWLDLLERSGVSLSNAHSFHGTMNTCAT